VPRYNELLFPNNHTSGTSAGIRTPDALLRDTDQAIGQLVDRVSHSPIWRYSAIFVVQDDAQDGADHVEGHRITSLVASPYARRGAVVSTHYDQVSVIRTIELILGMKPTYMYDALARPMWEAFQSTPDTRAFSRSSIPAPLMDERNVAHAPMARASKRWTWVADAVPQDFMNRMDWAYRYGTPRACPARVGRVPYNPCDAAYADAAGEIAKGKATQRALRRLATSGPTR
jgi:phospholipase C